MINHISRVNHTNLHCQRNVGKYIFFQELPRYCAIRQFASNNNLLLALALYSGGTDIGQYKTKYKLGIVGIICQVER
jgi:hypothetical protein